MPAHKGNKYRSAGKHSRLVVSLRGEGYDRLVDALMEAGISPSTEVINKALKFVDIKDFILSLVN